MRGPLRLGLLLAATVAALAGCGGRAHPALSPGCTGDAQRIVDAARAGGTLPDGTLLSQCVADAQTDADLQNVASAFTIAADMLAARAVHDAGAARALGILIGAGQRGAADSEGNATELANRLAADARRVHETAPRLDRVVNRATADGRARG